ncbi:hypothetical protein GX50_08784 [[Emmonsia] crescens]|uniref:Uncharacterized protein n=1 Tax=[Emmonsia] crescens TaxID=73230 RepID=A0A2B7YWM1_9EURO|nr:hypothetical protein GX50_08784 [Emmonsia crescens]
MSLTQPMSPPSRQPFGVIDPSRLRFLQSAKNQQNGISAPSLKRRLETSDLSDSENVDPSSSSGAKRTRNSLDEDVSKTTKTTTRFTFAPPSTPKRLHQTPLSQIIKRAPLPNSAPLRAPAGRSPKSKPAKAFSRRSIGSSYTRIDPPSFTKPHAAPRAPFSIADALHGTLNNTINTSVANFQSQSQSQTHTQTLQSTKITALDINNISSSSSKRHPKAWDFEIYADTEQDEMANLMEHSTCVLDISDDEDKSRNKDDRGKENIPPPSPLVGFGGQRVVDGGEVVNYNNNATAAADGADGTSRNVEMTDNEQRAALGELDVAHFVSVSKEEADEDEGEEEEKNENENERERERENASSTIDPTAIPLPPPTEQEDESSQLQSQSQSQSQEEKEKASGSESEACEIIASSSSTSSSSSSRPTSQPQPSSSNDTYYHYHHHHHHHHHNQQQKLHQNQYQYQNQPTLASHAAISALISSTAPVVVDTTTNTAAATSSSFPTGNEIEIWESGSAADEAEA